MSRKKFRAYQPPPQGVPAVVRMKILEGHLTQVREQAERQRRLLWMAIHAAGGRIEIDEDLFRMTLQGPASDYMFKTQEETVFDPKENRDVKKAVIVFCDEEGNVEERSKPKRIITL